MENNKTTYVIFGASGDLAKRYLLPALNNMKYVGSIVPISRKDYGNLKNLITEGGEKIFHLAIPPQGVPEAVETISTNFGNQNLKIMMEKPFGQDLQSAQSLVEHTAKYFSEDQLYRVDHYLGKDSVQTIAKTDWDKNNVTSIEVIASEKIDIEGRVNFYEQTGALKDFVQSHLLEVLSLVLSGSLKTSDRCESLRELAVVCDITKKECVKRGQYEGYREEVGNSESLTETYVSINMVSNDPKWKGVAIRLATGKALKEKLTQVKITYNDGTVKIFNIEHEPGAYERVIKAAISGNHDLFIGSDEVLETWRILHVIQESWKGSTDDLVIYPKGSSIDEI